MDIINIGDEVIFNEYNYYDAYNATYTIVDILPINKKYNSLIGNTKYKIKNNLTNVICEAFANEITKVC